MFFKVVSFAHLRSSVAPAAGRRPRASGWVAAAVALLVVAAVPGAAQAQDELVVRAPGLPLGISVDLTVGREEGVEVAPPAPGSLTPKSIPQTGAQPTFDDQLAQLAAAIPSFGGLFVDEKADTLFVYLTRSNARTLALVARRLRALFDIPERRTKMLKARYDWGQLKTWSDRMTTGVWSLAGVTMTDIDDRSNRLVVGVEDLRLRGALHRRLDRLSIPRDAVRIVRRPPAPEDSSLQHRHRALMSGFQISKSGGGRCTLGFIAWNPRHQKWGIVTNTHCTDTRGSLEGTRFFQHARSNTPFEGRPGTDSNEIAREVDDPAYFTGGDCPVNRRCRYSDSAFAAITSSPNPRPQFFLGYFAEADFDSPNWRGGMVEIGHEEHYPVVGRLVIKVGKTTGVTLGEVTNTCLTVNSYTNDGDTGTTMICQARADYRSDSGDSGGPVFSLSQDNGWQLAGLHWRGGGTFSPIGQVQRSGELGWLYFCTSRC